MNCLRVLVRSVILQLREIIQILLWFFQSKRVVMKLGKRYGCENISTLHIEKALILCPHADDEWIGCSSILANDTINSHVLYYRMYGLNQSESNKAVRDSEIERCALKWNFVLLNNVLDIVDFLSNSIIEEKYDTILIPSPIDWHWEHRSVFCSLLEAIGKIGKFDDVRILYYYVSVPSLQEKNVFYSELTKEYQHNKWLFFKNNYKSQNMPIYRYKLQEKINSARHSSYASELFKLASYEQLIFDFNRLHEQKYINRLDNLRFLINDIYKIRKIIGELEK